jgi:hypothetical protein
VAKRTDPDIFPGRCWERNMANIFGRDPRLGPDPRRAGPRRHVAEAQETADVIKNWLARPRRKANVAALACVSLTMLALFVAASGLPDRDEVLRGTALFFVGIHCMLHLTWIRWLKHERNSGVAVAEAALQEYRDPRRVTGLDVAMAWLGFAAFAPVLNSILAIGLATGGE